MPIENFYLDYVQTLIDSEVKLNQVNTLNSYLVNLTEMSIQKKSDSEKCITNKSRTPMLYYL